MFRLLLIYFGFLYLQSGLTASLTLEDTKNYAVQMNLGVQTLQAEVEAAEQELLAAKSSFYPSLGAAGGFQNQSADILSQSTALAYVYLNMNLYRGGKDSLQIDELRNQLRQAEIKLEKAKLNVKLDVELVFHENLYHQEVLGHLDSAIKRNQGLSKMVRTRRDRGLSPKSDVMDFELVESLLESRRISMLNQIASTRVSLKRYLGPKVGESIEPVGELQHQHLTGNLQSYVDRIETETEDILLNKELLRLASIQASKVKSEYLPTIDLEAHAGYEPLDERPNGGGATIDGKVVAKWDLFSGFQTKRSLSAANSRRTVAENRLKDAILNALTEIERSYRHLVAIQQQVDIEAKNRVLSLKLYEAVISEYKRGVKSSGDVKEAAASVFEAHQIESQYKFDFLKEKIALERALGGEVTTELIKHDH